jgi:eukaryotic-like serine/threonine-protein kinase
MITDGQVGNGEHVIEVSSRVADRYRIDARIGGGGMADVFEARDESLDRDVAIKLLRGIDDPAAARRFAEEIRLTARLNHPNVVQLFDAGEHDGSPYLVLERVTGGTLSQAMAEEGMAAQRVADIGRQTAAALEHAHAEGVVHRDVKPSNILLTAEGTVRLADFGIALTATATRLTVAGSVAGSAGYVSPEQVLGTGAGAASDVYALGLVLLECLTGQPPWSGTTVEVALARITADPPIPDTVPEAWRGLLTAMTARSPEDRPPMGVVATALGDLAAGRATIAFPTPVPVAPPRRRRRVPLAAAASVALLLVAGAAVMLNRPAISDATPVVLPSAVAPDGIIAASVVRGAAVGEATQAAEPAGEQAAERQDPTQRRPAGDDAGTGSTAAIGGASIGGASAAGAPSDTAPGAASQPAPQRDVAEPTRTKPTRDTADDSPAPSSGSTTEGGDSTGGTDDTAAAGEDSDTTDVTEPTATNRGKGKGIPAGGPGVSSDKDILKGAQK